MPCTVGRARLFPSLAVPGDVTVGLVFTCGTEGTEHAERRAKAEEAHALQCRPSPSRYPTTVLLKPPPPEARPVGRTGRTVNITGRARDRARVKTDLPALLLLLTALV